MFLQTLLALVMHEFRKLGMPPSIDTMSKKLDEATLHITALLSWYHISPLLFYHDEYDRARIAIKDFNKTKPRKRPVSDPMGVKYTQKMED